MSEHKKYIPEGSSDMERLIYAMKQLKNKNYHEIDESVFEDKAVAEEYNEMLNSVVGYNNHFLMRINEAMSKIAVNDNVKNMLTRINSQKAPIDSMKENNIVLNELFVLNMKQLIEALALTKQVDNTLMPVAKKAEKAEHLTENIMNELDMMLSNKNLKKQEILRTCESVREQGVEALNLSRIALEQILGIKDQSTIVRKILSDICMHDNSNMGIFKDFELALQSLTDNYDNLSKYCFDVGSQLYHISRDIDSARNDMYRHNSRPTMIDSLSVFFTDHLTLTWRLYLNAIEYDNLKITQLNNPDRCKFGLWYAGLQDGRIRDSEEMKEAFDLHEELHERAVTCFLAKEASDLPAAFEEFDRALEVCGKFEKALYNLSNYMRSIGITEETDVWKFRV